MRRRRLLILALSAGVFVVALAAFIGDRLGQRTYPPAIPTGEIAFTTNRFDGWDIARYAPESGLTRQTPDDAFSDYFTSFDFSGERINYLSNRIAGDQLSPTQITPGDVADEPRVLEGMAAVTTLFIEGRLDWDATWNADGALLWSSLRDLNLELYVRPTADAEAIRLTQGGARDWFHAWSPDGSQIAFSSDREGDENVYLMNADGSGLIQVTTSTFDDLRPAFSLDGQTLLLVSERDGALMDGVLNLYLIPLADALAGNGETAMRRFTSQDTFEGGAAYNADGSQMVLMRGTGAGIDLILMDVDDAGAPIRDSAIMIASGSLNLFPAWRP